MGTKQYDNALDLITFSRASNGTSLRKISYGSELVTNGTFDADVSGWTGADGTIAAVSGELELTYTTDTQYVYASVSTTAGKVYRLNIDGRSANSVNWKLIVQANSFGGTTLAETTEQPFLSSLETRSVNFVATSATTVILMFSRLTSGTAYFDNISVKEVLFDQPDGTLTLFNHPDDIPRIDYNPDGTVKGLLIEEQRTNLVTYSTDIETQWVATGSPTFSAGTSVLGLPTERITASASVDTKVEQQFSVTSGSSYTGSIILGKTYSGSGWLFLFFTTSFPSSASWFDLNTGTFDSVAADAEVHVQDLGDAWLIGITATANATGTPSFRIEPCTANGATTAAAGDAIEVAAAQLEEGAFPTSYIPTSGATATREPDIASIPVADFGYNQKAGSLVVEGSVIGLPSIAGYLASITDGTTSKMLVSFVQSSENLRFGVINGSDFTVGLNTANISAGDSLNFAAAYSLNDIAQSLNGAGVQTDTSATIPSPLTIMRIGNRDDAARALNGHIKSIQYYPRRLTNAQLQELTA